MFQALILACVVDQQGQPTGCRVVGYTQPYDTEAACLEDEKTHEQVLTEMGLVIGGYKCKPLGEAA